MDGVWYAWSDKYYGPFKALAPGRQMDNIAVFPISGWGKDPRQFPARAGQHKIRFAFVAGRGEPNRRQTIRAVSNPIEVEFRTGVAPKEAASPPPNAPNPTPAAQPGSQRGEAPSSNPPSSAWPSSFAGPSTSAGLTADGTEGRQSALSSVALAKEEIPNSKSAWGSPVEGVSVQLSAEGAVWDFRQQGFFKFSVRNQGKQSVAVWRSQAEGELEMDGVWYRWSQPVDAKTSVLAPGGQFDGLALSLGGGEWRKDGNLLAAGVGKHTLRFAVPAMPESGGAPIRVVSNPMDVEFRWPASATSPPITFVPGDLPVIADIGGRVVDDETGAPLTNFWVQEGMADPAKTNDILWSQSFRARSSPARSEANFVCRAASRDRPGVCWPTVTCRNWCWNIRWRERFKPPRWWCA